MQNGTAQLRLRRSILQSAFFILHSNGGCGSTAEYGRAKAETTVRLRPPAPFFGDLADQSRRVGI